MRFWHRAIARQDRPQPRGAERGIDVAEPADAPGAARQDVVGQVLVEAAVDLELRELRQQRVRQLARMAHELQIPDYDYLRKS